MIKTHFHILKTLVHLVKTFLHVLEKSGELVVAHCSASMHRVGPGRQAHFLQKIRPRERRFLRGLTYVVGEEGIEPSQDCSYRILSPARLPVPPLARISFSESLRP
jgi:hypothetical protein